MGTNSSKRSNAIHVPTELKLQKKSFSIKIVRDLYEYINLDFFSTSLEIPDSIGGPTAHVNVEFAKRESTVYLRPLESIPKAEFESIFGLRPGENFKLRVIAVDSSVFGNALDYVL